jgi:hypothetical protein
MMTSAHYSGDGQDRARTIRVSHVGRERRIDPRHKSVETLHMPDKQQR